MSSVVPEGWIAERLGDVSVLITKGTTPKTYINDGVNFIKVESISTNRTLIMDKLSKIDLETHDLQKRSQLESGDILFSIAGSLGRIAVVRSEHLPANTNQALALIRLKDGEIDNAYCIQQLSAGRVQSEIKNLQTVGAQPNLSLQQVSDFLINCPPLPEQKKIASILTSVDEVIENTQKQIDKLQDLKKATMNELLTKGMGHTEFKDSELGRIPKSWEARELGDIATFSGGSAFKEMYQGQNSGKHPFIKVSDMNLPENNRYIVQANNWVSEEIRQQAKIKLFPSDSVVFAKVGAALLLNRRRQLIRETAIDNNMMAAIPNACDHNFLYYSMQTINLGNIVQSGAVPSVNQSQMESIPTVIPPLPEQKKIASRLTSVDEVIENTQKQINKLQDLKKSLMQDLLTGKVRVTVN